MTMLTRPDSSHKALTCPDVPNAWVAPSYWLTQGHSLNGKEQSSVFCFDLMALKEEVVSHLFRKELWQ